MPKRKNHTSANQNKKAHRNGIKKPRFKPFSSTKGMETKFLLNYRQARKFAKIPGGKEAWLAQQKEKKDAGKKDAEMIVEKK